jgi:hypothetical protein
LVRLGLGIFLSGVTTFCGQILDQLWITLGRWIWRRLRSRLNHWIQWVWIGLDPGRFVDRSFWAIHFNRVTLGFTPSDKFENVLSGELDPLKDLTTLWAFPAAWIHDGVFAPMWWFAMWHLIS